MLGAVPHRAIEIVPLTDLAMRAAVLLLTVTLVFSLANCRSAPARQEPGPKEAVEKPDAEPDEKSTQRSDKTTEEKKQSETSEVDTRPDRKGRPVRTSFYGAELVREKVLVDGIPVTRISIRGGAVLKHNDVTIRAPQIYLDAGNIGRCVGGVLIEDPKNGLRIRAASALYDRGAQELRLEGKPFLTIRRAKEAPVLISSTKMLRLMGEGKSILEGDVRMFQKPWNLMADTGVYHDQGNALVLSPEPVLIGPDGFMTGETLTYHVRERLVRFEKRVILITTARSGGPFTPAAGALPTLDNFSRTGGRYPVGGLKAPEDAKSASGTPGAQTKQGSPDLKQSVDKSSGNEDDTKTEEPDNRAILAGDALSYFFPKEQSPHIQVDGNVRLRQKDMNLSTTHMRAEGKDMQKIIADKGVHMIEKKNNVRVQAGRMIYDRALGLLRLDQKPKMEFLKKGTTEVTGELTAHVIERDVRQDRTTARGNVRVERGTTIATGAFADYDRLGDVIVVEGDPALQRGKSKVHCEQILIFPTRNRVLLRDRVSGSLLE